MEHRRAGRVQRRVVRAIRSRALQSPRLRRLALRRGRREAGLVEAVLFELNDHDRVGFVDPVGYTRFCCAEDLVESTGCVPGRLIVTPRDDDPESPWAKAVPFSGDDVDARVYDQTVRRKTGNYLWFVSCDPELGPSLSVRGAGRKNPSGYLPGMVRFMLPFYGVLSLAYLGARRRDRRLRPKWHTLMPLRYCVALVVALGMAESSAWYFDYVNFNATGYALRRHRLRGSPRVARRRSLVSRARRGDGVRRRSTHPRRLDPRRGWPLPRVFRRGVGARSGGESGQGGRPDVHRSARVGGAVAFLGAACILWIFTALSRALAQTQARRREVKFELYRRFTNALAVCVVASVGWIFYEMWFKVTDMINESGRAIGRRAFRRRSRSASPPPSVGSGDLQRTERGTRTPGRTRRTIGRTTARRWEGQGCS